MLIPQNPGLSVKSSPGGRSEVVADCFTRSSSIWRTIHVFSTLSTARRNEKGALSSESILSDKVKLFGGSKIVRGSDSDIGSILIGFSKLSKMIAITGTVAGSPGLKEKGAHVASGVRICS